MFSLKETIEIFGKSVRLGLLFEVVDDPEDRSEFLRYRKAIDVWFFAGTKRLDNLSLDLIRQDGRCIRNITQATPPELRKYAFTSFENGYLHVIAVPTPEWEGIYQPRIYAPLAIESGRTYNFAVSVPARPVQAGPTSDAPPTSSLSPVRGFRL